MCNWPHTKRALVLLGMNGMRMVKRVSESECESECERESLECQSERRECVCVLLVCVLGPITPGVLELHFMTIE